MQDLAAAEKIHPSYLSRVLWLTLLAPDIVEVILDGRQPPTLQLDQLFKPPCGLRVVFVAGEAKVPSP